MTYCIGLCLDQGLVLLADTRTNAGVDQIGTFRKMTIFQKDKERFFALMSSGNLAVTQAVRLPRLSGLQLKKYETVITNPYKNRVSNLTVT